MNPRDIATGSVGRDLLADLHAGELRRPGALEEIGEADLLQRVVTSALTVGSLGKDIALSTLVPEPTTSELALAKRLSHCPAARWWTNSWSARSQIWVCPKGSGPPVRGGPHEPATGKPSTALWTSSSVAGIGSAWMPVATTGLIHYVPDELWHLELCPRLPVAEIHTVSDWRALCNEAPGCNDTNGLIEPDWQALARRFDGVHLSVAGLLAVQGVPIADKDGVAMLWGWDAESTAWLNWCVTSARKLSNHSHIPGRGG